MRTGLVLLSVLVLSQAAFSQHRYGSEYLYHNSSTFEVGTQLFNFDYKEVWEAPRKSNESGFIPGFSLAYTYRGNGLPLYLRGSFEYTSSQTNYEGGVQYADGTYAPWNTKTDNSFMRLEAQAGYSFRFGRNFSLTPYTGYGYRSWTRHITGDAGYEEHYFWSYIPVGVRGDLMVGRMFAMGLNVAARFMFSGGMDLKLYDNPTLELGSKHGFRISLPSAIHFSPNWALGFEPWYEFSGINESKPHIIDPVNGNGVREPESSTNIFGTNLTLQYGF